MSFYEFYGPESRQWKLFAHTKKNRKKIILGIFSLKKNLTKQKKNKKSFNEFLLKCFSFWSHRGDDRLIDSTVLLMFIGSLFFMFKWTIINLLVE